MIDLHTIGTTRIYIGCIDCFEFTPSLSRREREQSATLMILHEIFGPETDIRFSHTADGAPRLTVDGAPRFISVSHSRQRIGIAVDDFRPVGLDIEEWREQLLRVESHYIRPEERSEWCISGNSRLGAWMAKEAAYKLFEPRGVTLLSICLRGSVVKLGDRQASIHYGPGFALAVPRY